MTRRHGEPAARAMLEVNEIRGDYLRGQSQDERETDEHNNEIGIAIGRESHTYEEIVKRAREKIDTSVPHNGSGAEGSPKWLKESQWGEAGGNNWPPNWSDVTPAKDYEYGGEEHRYGPRTDADPMERPVDTWSEDDVRRVMSSDAYQRQADPGHKLAQDKVRG
ncbi:MAG: hypothetical protein ACE5GT_02410 [Rhodospirillales bacterium]